MVVLGTYSLYAHTFTQTPHSVSIEYTMNRYTHVYMKMYVHMCMHTHTHIYFNNRTGTVLAAEIQKLTRQTKVSLFWSLHSIYTLYVT